MTYCVTCHHDSCPSPAQSQSAVMEWHVDLAVPPDDRGQWWAWLHGPRDQTPQPAWWGRSRDRGAA